MPRALFDGSTGHCSWHKRHPNDPVIYTHLWRVYVLFSRSGAEKRPFKAAFADQPANRVSLDHNPAECGVDQDGRHLSPSTGLHFSQVAQLNAAIAWAGRGESGIAS